MELQAEEMAIEEPVVETPVEILAAPAAESDGVAGEQPGEPTVAEEDGTKLARIIESVLFAAGAPLTIKRISDILGGPRRGPSNKEIAAALAQLEREYAPGQRGIQMVQVAGGYQLRTARENAEWVRSVFRERPTRLGRAQMETLAIIAYRQPVTRAEIEAIRGVDADSAVTNLLGRRLIKIAGRKEAVGRPLLYATTPEFLEAFGLKDLAELPSLKELGPVTDEEAIQRAIEANLEVAPAADSDDSTE
ncbi:MAG TPA: SMC-Scp complex subunit ScpB, partial [Terriglobales bacterium]|nr:SMC-Scp complex subunit ScpB [Terriglobales bacterium]